MRDLFFKLFSKSHFNTGITITPLSIPHIVYILLIGGIITGLYFHLRKKDAFAKKKAMRVLVNVLVFSYLSDFFIHEFVYASYDDVGNLISGGGLDLDKLPFHLCTALCPVVAFTQYNKKGRKILEPVCVLAILAPLMYLAYPASIGNGEPWCYQAVQTMFFHGTLLAWGMLNVLLGITELKIKNCWKCAIALVGITLWAKLGNILYGHNWFFLQEDAFYIGLVENYGMPSWILMIINPIVFFLAVLLVYGVYYLVNRIRARVGLKAEEKEPAFV